MRSVKFRLFGISHLSLVAGLAVAGHVADGSDKDSLGAWPEKRILATQVGPNRNGRKW